MTSVDLSRGTGVRHLYVHLPFCAHRCGYCDFVTVVGRQRDHAPYVDGLLAELELERESLAPDLETLYFGGGTPTLTVARELERLLAALPPAAETTVEANPETISLELARALRGAGVDRVSLGVQSFDPELLSVLERRAGPDDVRRAYSVLRQAGFDNVSFDLIYGIPGQGLAELSSDLEQAIALGPEHLSCYELEAKHGTRFTSAYGEELDRQAEAMEGHFELVVEMLGRAGYRWYETANFCRPGRQARHNLAYWTGRDYLGLGVGAVSTVSGLRWRNRPSLAGYLRATSSGNTPPRELEPLDDEILVRERLMLRLRLDEPLRLAEVEGAYDPEALERLERLGLLTVQGDEVLLTDRGRLLGGGTTVALLAEIPANSAI